VTRTPPVLDRPEADLRDPWDRFGWVMGVVWLVFLGFPIAAAATGDQSWVLRALGVALILLFGVCYVHGFVRLGRACHWTEVVTWGWRYVAALAVIMLAVSALTGLAALGMMPFVVAMAMFVLPLRVSFAVFAAAVGVTAVAASTAGMPFSQGGEVWFLVVMVVLVGVVTAAVRILDHLGAEHRELTSDLTVATERDRVARDVHDVLGHSLTAVTVKAELAERLVDVDPERAKAELAQIQKLTRGALAEIRATVGGLRVARLTDEIDAARDALADAGITVDVPADPAVVDPSHRVVLAWALREAVTNVVRHSSASTCRIELGTDWLVVADDGHGLRSRREGNGLRGLRERVGAAGGEVDLEPGSDGLGTSLRVRL